MLEYIKKDSNGVKRLHANAVRFRDGRGRITITAFGPDGYYQAHKSVEQVLQWDEIETIFERATTQPATGPQGRVRR